MVATKFHKRKFRTFQDFSGHYRNFFRTQTGKSKDISWQFSRYGQFIRTQKQKFQDIHRICQRMQLFKLISMQSLRHGWTIFWFLLLGKARKWRISTMLWYKSRGSTASPKLKSGHFRTFLRKFIIYQDISGQIRTFEKIQDVSEQVRTLATMSNNLTRWLNKSRGKALLRNLWKSLKEITYPSE